MGLMVPQSQAQLNFFLQTMLAEEVVNNEFVELQSMKTSCGKDFVIRSIIDYWNAVKHLFTQMSTQLEMYYVDLDDIRVCADDLLARSKSIGAACISIACNDILSGCNNKEIDRCKEALTTAKREFARLQVKLESVVELERNIIEGEDT